MKVLKSRGSAMDAAVAGARHVVATSSL